MKITAYVSLILGAGILGVAADPALPVLVSPASNAVDVSTSPTLQVNVSEPGNGNLTVRFYSRLAVGPGPDFTIAALPDSQYYSSSMNGGTPAIFAAQTDWIVANRAASNIAYVAHLGDIVNYGDTNRGVEELTAWRNATNALYRLENPATTGLSNGIPYGAAVGNHDQSPNGEPDGTTRYYNQFFGVSHFANRSYYGGHYGTNNDNHFDLFSASGLDFIAVYFEYDLAANSLVLNWANNLLQTYTNRRAIVVSHYIGRATTPSTFGDQGAAIYNALRTNANFFLMLSGHVAGEGSRTDVFNGHTVQTLVSDYQYYDNGGHGLMRLMQFSPSNGVIRVTTYSPWLNEYQTDGDSQFTIPYSMPPSVAASDTNFRALGTNFNVASGSATSFLWPELLPNHTYEWYVTVTDSSNHTVTGPTWRFTTQQETAPRGVSAGSLQVSQIAGFSGADENTNCQVALTLGVNTFRPGTFNRGDYNVQVGWSATDDPGLGVLLGCVTQNGRDNYGTDYYCTAGIATNASGSYRIVTYASTNGTAGDGFEYNVNVAAAWFPYAEYLGGLVRNSGGTNGGGWDLLTGSRGLALGTHVISFGDGEGVVNLTSLGIDSRRDGVLLVSHAKDEGNYALSQVNTTDGTWNVFIHDNSTGGSDCEQDPLAFVFIPRTNTAVISGRFLGDGALAMYSGATPQFTVTHIAMGRWELKIPGYSPTNGVLITSAEGGGSYNVDNIVTYQANANGDGWIVESRDLPACDLQSLGTEPVASFVFIPAPPPGITLDPANNLVTTEPGGRAVFTMALRTEPTTNVVVAVVSSDTSEGTVSPASLTFTINDWNVPQMAVITGVDDSVNDGDTSYSLTCTVSSSDPLYAAVQPVTVSVTNIDDEEGLTLPSGVLFYGVGMPAVGLDGRATVVDPETPNYHTGSLTATLIASATADDRLEIRNTGTGAGQIGVSGSTVRYGGTVIGTFAGGQGTTPLVVTFSSAMTRAAAEALVRSITFRNVSTQPSLNTRTVSIVLVDGNNLASSATKAIWIGQLRVADFQEGADGGYGPYTGAANLELYQVNPNTAYPAGHSASGLWVDYPDNANACHLLLRFDNIIGSGLGQIPSNAIVVSAELMLYAANAGDGSPLYRMLRSWNAATDTWNTLVTGVQTNNVEARSTFDSQIGSYDGAGTGAAGAISVGVTPDVQAWVSGQTNYGWVMPGWPSYTDGTAFLPSQAANIGDRPRLRVKWLPAGTALASFRRGINGYANAYDTRLRENAPEADASAVTSMYIDAGVTSTSDPEQILLRFDNIVGAATNQIPPGSRIEAAMLDLASVVGNGPGDGGYLHALLKPWQDTTSTWNSWIEGIQADGVEAAITPTVILGNASRTPNVQGGFHSLDVTADVQACVSGTGTNYGWVGLPWPGGTDGWGIATAESTVARNRPQLRVYYSLVTNALPAIVLTTPANNASFAAPAAIDLAAAVTANGNTINYVGFYAQGTNLIANVSNAPYACLWTNVGAGIYSLTARLAYNAGSTADSAASIVTVTNRPQPAQPIITSPSLALSTFSMTFTTEAGPLYKVECKNGLGDPTWQLLATVPGTGAPITFTDNAATNTSRFYRVQAQ